MSRPRFAARLLLVAAVAALPACTLLNDPTALPAPPSDGGAIDAEGLDAGDASDGGNVDGGPVCRPREVCFNGVDVDDDCDDAVDCADLDCANEASCCVGAGAPLFTEDWAASNFGLRWKFAAPDDETTFAVGGALGGFGSDGMLRSLMPRDVADRCVPLALGARIEVSLTSLGGRCTACSDEAAVVLTGADSPARGVALAADLRVGLTGDGMLSVTSGATSLLTRVVPVVEGVRVVVEISPSVRDGVAVLTARVTTGTSPDLDVIVSDGAFIAQSLLRACPGGPGLAIAVEGRGSGVTVGNLAVTPLACTNPRVFGSGGDAFTGDDVGAAGGWTSGGISAPALLVEATALHLFYDGTNVERDLERIAPIDFAIGAADAISFSAGWTSLVGGNAYLGTTPPACTTPPCAARPSVREPTASASYRLNAITGATHTLAYATELAGAPDVFAIEYVDAPTGPAAPSSTPIQLLAPSSDCVSVRDPHLAQAGDFPEDGLWLFYTCERAVGASTIRAVALDPTTGTLAQRPGTDVEVLGPGIGAYAARGVASPAAIVRVHEVSASFPQRTLAVRLWFVARGGDGRRSVALAEAQTVVDVAEEAQIPTLTAYPANPLMYGDAAVLGACDGMCDVRDVGIGRLPSSTALTVLVARRVDRTAGGTEWQLVPLVQTLEARWWGVP